MKLRGPRCAPTRLTLSLNEFMLGGAWGRAYQRRSRPCRVSCSATDDDTLTDVVMWICGVGWGRVAEVLRVL
jgi:hypothetical protein